MNLQIFFTLFCALLLDFSDVFWSVVLFTAPNSYTLPQMLGKTVQSSKNQAPCYSLTGRSKVGAFSEDLAKVGCSNSCSLFNHQNLKLSTSFLNSELLRYQEHASFLFISYFYAFILTKLIIKTDQTIK